MKTVAVIGAGIAGITSAYYLAKQGYDVTVYEKESYPAMRTSYANGGQISVSNSEVWTSWSNIRKAITWLGKKDAPLLIRPQLDWDKALWLCKFLYNTAKGDAQQRTAQTIYLGLQSRKLYQEIIQEENINFDYNQCGILHFYKDKKYFESAKNLQELYEINGCQWKILSANEVVEFEPTLKNAENIIGGTWTADDSVGDIHKFCVELTNVLMTKYNAKFIFDCDIGTIEQLDHDYVVVANGVGSVKLAKSIGDKLPIYPVKGYSITIQDKYDDLIPSVSLLDDQAKIVTSKLGNRLRVAGTAEFAGENYDIRKDRIDPLLNWVKINLPQISRRDYTQWACLRPMTPTMLPIIQQSKSHIKVYYHVGHGHLGWTLCPATAQQLTKLITS